MDAAEELSFGAGPGITLLSASVDDVSELLRWG